VVYMGPRNMGRPLDDHIDNEELNALVPWSAERGRQPRKLSLDVIREAERHLGCCTECRDRVSKYQQFVNELSNVPPSIAAPRVDDCPQDEDIDWHEVAAGQWPELKARQLIMHAALCDHCGPLLRAATFVNDDPTPQEEKLLAQLKVPSRPVSIQARVTSPRQRWQFTRWLVPAAAFIALVVALTTRPPSLPQPSSGPEFAQFAVDAHRQHAQGSLALAVHSDSQQTINDWFKTNSQFALALPASPAAPGEVRPYRLEGARFVPFRGKTAAYIAYRLQTGPASLMVTSDSLAAASGGVQVNFEKLTLHYSMLEGYKVVTWTVHGLTYALVSQEGNSTQQSCMVCHSAIRDRDLSNMPTPLPVEKNVVRPIWQ
jgi:anti-sigma factor RsiW